MTDPILDNRYLRERLEMAESLLRRARPITQQGAYLYLNRLYIRPDEAEYLRSLGEEGSSDE